MIFERNLKRCEGTGVFADFFGGYPALVHRLEKKIGCRKIFDFGWKWGIFRESIFLSTPQIHAKQLPNKSAKTPVSSAKSRFLPNIKVIQGRADQKATLFSKKLTAPNS
jgi:hypothetical protein